MINMEKRHIRYLKASIKYRARIMKYNPLQISAHAKLKYAVSIGKIIKPSNCSICNKLGKIEGHHNDYNKPYEVIWFCVKCHKAHHKQLKASHLLLMPV